jgi:hypothetical protein
MALLHGEKDEDIVNDGFKRWVPEQLVSAFLHLVSDYIVDDAQERLGVFFSTIIVDQHVVRYSAVVSRRRCNQKQDEERSSGR